MSRIFVSCADADENFGENLKHSLKARYGIESWLFCRDRKLGEQTWKDIEINICDSAGMSFIASRHTKDSKGQQRELTIARAAKLPDGSALPIIPVIVLETEMPYAMDDIPFTSLPDGLEAYNGIQIHRDQHEGAAYQLASILFPEKVGANSSTPWRTPRPGKWLVVRSVDNLHAEDFHVGDRVYFRRLSPLGLFECYSPQIGDLFWFYPYDLAELPADHSEDAPPVPNIFQITTSIYAESQGFKALIDEGKVTVPKRKRRARED